MVGYKAAAGLLSLVVLGVIGCESSSDSGGGASMDQMVAQVEAQKSAQQQQEQARQEAERKAQEAQQAAAAAATATQPPSTPERKLAGREQVAPGGGYYREIIGARRHVLNVADRLPWLQAVQHFQATEGRLPKDHAEFMSKIVEPLGIDLGYIEEGQEFLYDPSEGEWGELYVVEKVERPAQ
jgi:hypothetical protein